MKEYFERYIKNFGMLSDEEIALIVSHTDVREFKKGSQLHVLKNCFLVLDGGVREYILKDGLEKTTAFYLSGDSIVANPKETKEKYWQCLDKCILTISNQNIEKEMCRLIPRLQSIILNEVQESSMKVKDDFTVFISSSAEERYQYLLESKPAIFQKATQLQIASYIGITPESLSRLKQRIKSKS